MQFCFAAPFAMRNVEGTLLFDCVLHVAQWAIDRTEKVHRASNALAGYDNNTPSAERCRAGHILQAQLCFCITFADEGMAWNER